MSAYSKGLIDANRIKINTLGGELFVSFEFNNVYDNIWLEGPAIEVFKGYIYEHVKRKKHILKSLRIGGY